jgi:hypothetical protein
MFKALKCNFKEIENLANAFPGFLEKVKRDY